MTSSTINLDTGLAGVPGALVLGLDNIEWGLIILVATLHGCGAKIIHVNLICGRYPPESPHVPKENLVSIKLNASSANWSNAHSGTFT